MRTVTTFTRDYFLSLLAIIPLTGLLGWLLAGRAIQPVNEVAQAAQKITGSNLSLQIPLRGAGDELDHLIGSFNRMTTRLEDSFEQIRRFSTDVSHELRTPLTAIRGQLEVALFTAQTPEQYRDAMVNALEDVEQLSSIVRALLLLVAGRIGPAGAAKDDLGSGRSRRGRGGSVPDSRRGEARAAHGPDRTGRGDSGRPHPDRTAVLQSAFQCRQVHSRRRHRSGARSRQDDERRIGDESKSKIPAWASPAENLPHIFDRFYRVRNAETNLIQGLGLGLSFVAWIVKAHGGQIESPARWARGPGSRSVCRRKPFRGGSGERGASAAPVEPQRL